MKRLFILFFIAIFSLSAFAVTKWDPTADQFRNLGIALHEEKDREKVYNLFKQALESGLNANYMTAKTQTTFLMSIATVEYNRWDDPDRVSFTEWDKKLLKLLVDYGADLNRRVNYSEGNERTALMQAAEHYNLDLAKEMVALGADHLISLSDHSFQN